jgi:hypothetical protein
MDHWPERIDPTLARTPRDETAHRVGERRRQTADFVRTLPTHEQWLERVLGARRA